MQPPAEVRKPLASALCAAGDGLAPVGPPVAVFRQLLVVLPRTQSAASSGPWQVRHSSAIAVGIVNDLRGTRGSPASTAQAERWHIGHRETAPTAAAPSVPSTGPPARAAHLRPGFGADAGGGGRQTVRVAIDADIPAAAPTRRSGPALQVSAHQSGSSIKVVGSLRRPARPVTCGNWCAVKDSNLQPSGWAPRVQCCPVVGIIAGQRSCHPLPIIRHDRRYLARLGRKRRPFRQLDQRLDAIGSRCA